MAQTLVNLVQFVGLPVGVPTSLPHRLVNVDGYALTPDILLPSVGGLIVTGDSINVTVTRPQVGDPADIDIFAIYIHTTPRSLLPNLLNLPVQPFVPDYGGGAAAPGDSSCIIYQPGGPSNGPVIFNSWATIMLKLAALRAEANGGGCYTIVFDTSFVSPAVIPLGGPYDMTGVAWQGAENGIPVFVEIANGASFIGLRAFSRFLAVRNMNLVTPAEASLVNGDQIILDQGATLDTVAGGAPFYRLSGVGAGQVVIVGFISGAHIGTDLTGPVFHVPNAGSQLVITGTIDGQTAGTAVTGVAGAFLQFVASAVENVPTVLPGFLGTILPPLLNTGPGLFPNPYLIAPAVAPVVASFDQWIRLNASSGPITQTLPSINGATNALRRPGGWLLVTEEGGGDADLAPAAGDTINGAVSYQVPPSGGVLLASDGLSNWRVALDSGSGVGGASNCLIYRPSGPTNGPVIFSSWASLMTQLGALRAGSNGGGCYEIVVDDSFAQPATSPPAGIYDLTDCVLSGTLRPGEFGHAQLNIAEGVRFTNLFTIRDLDIRNMVTATPVITVANEDAFFIGPNCDISSFAPAAAPFFGGAGVGAGQFYLIQLGEGGTLGSQGQVAANASIGANGTLLVEVRANGILQKSMVSGPVSATLGYLLTDTSALFGPQPSFLGTINFDFSSANIGPRLNFKPQITATPLVVATVITARDGVVRASVAGGPFTLTLENLPGVSFNEFGRPLVVFETSGTAGLSVTPGAGDTINGVAAAVDVPGGGAIILVPDGISNWLLISRTTGVGAAAPLMSFGDGNIGAPADTRFISPWNSSDTSVASMVLAEEEWPVPRPGTVKSLFVRHDSTTGNGNSVVYTIMKNSVATALTVTLATGAVGQASDLVNSVVFAQGDRIALRAVKAIAIGGGAILVRAGLEFAA